MVTFWCGWCGATAEAEHSEARVSCRRCAIEWWKLFGMRLRTDMTPLEEGEDAPVPTSAFKQFRFIDSSGAEVGKTQVDPLGVRRIRSKSRRRGA